MNHAFHLSISDYLNDLDNLQMNSYSEILTKAPPSAGGGINAGDRVGARGAESRLDRR
jgi:hypothetical protein